jgi:hypothetical protein
VERSQKNKVRPVEVVFSSQHKTHSHFRERGREEEGRGLGEIWVLSILLYFYIITVVKK